MRIKTKTIATKATLFLLGLVVGWKLTGLHRTQNLLLFLYGKERLCDSQPSPGQDLGLQGTAAAAMPGPETAFWHGEGHPFPGQSAGRGSETGPADSAVMIGVMTSRQYLSTRAAAIFATWGRDVGRGRILFYIGGTGNASAVDEDVSKGGVSRHETDEKPRTEPIQMMGQLPVVVLTDVNDTMYPPSQKCFAMLSHMHHNFGTHFRWFLRVDDDVYIRYQLLTQFLNSLNDSKLWYLGSPGYGTPDMIGHLGLVDNKPYCMGGPGIVFSAPTLRTLVPHLPTCQSSAVSKHEDSELGRCLQVYLNVSCDTQPLVHEVFRQVYKMNDFDTPLKEDMFSSVTFHPVKDPQLMRTLHREFQFRQLKTLYQHRQHLTADIQHMDEVIRVKETSHAEIGSSTQNPRGDHVIEKHAPGERDEGQVAMEIGDVRKVEDVPVWGCVENGRTKSMGPDCRLHYGLIKEINSLLRDLTREYGRIPGKHTVARYQKYSAAGGLQHSVTVFTGKVFKSFKVTVRLEELEWREFAHHNLSNTMSKTKSKQTRFPVQEKANKSENSLFAFFRESPSKEPQEDLPHGWTSSWPDLHVLVPLCGRHQTYLRFLEHLSKAAMQYPGRVHVCVGLYSDPLGEHNQTLDVSEANRELNITVIQLPGNFSRSTALNTLARPFLGDSILVSMDVDIMLGGQTLHRIALNMLPNTAYFPIVFSNYSPNTVCYGRPHCPLHELDYSEDRGLWRSYGYGVVALRADDFHKVGGLDTKIVGWGKEDVDFFKRCVSQGMQIFRAPDVGMIHKYHEKHCDRHLPKDQYAMCISSRLNQYGSEAQLALMTLDLHIDNLSDS